MDRHGKFPGASGIQTPAVRGQRKQPTLAPPGTTRIQKTTLTTLPEVKRIVPVRLLMSFFQNLPEQTIQQIALSGEDLYSEQELSIAGNRLVLFANRVPALTVYVLTDVLFYALAPTMQPFTPLQALTQYQLTGAVQFFLSFENRMPLRLESAAIDPGGSAIPLVGGWGLLDTPIGPRRTSGFALYARGNELIEAYATWPTVSGVGPQFPIERLGVHLHGFAVPENRFDKIWTQLQNM